MELQLSFVSSVAPGARERLVQITGPAEENIKYDITLPFSLLWMYDRLKDINVDA